MRLKSSEKKLIVVLLGAVVVALFVNYIFFPVFDQYKILSDQKAQLDAEYKEVLNSQLTDAQIKTMLQDATSKYEALKNKLPIYSHQEDAIVYLYNTSKAHSMNVDNYTFEYADASKAAEDSKTDESTVAPISDVLKEFSKMVKGDSNADVEQYKDRILKQTEGGADGSNTQTNNNNANNTNNNNTAETGTPDQQYEKDLSYLNVSLQLSGTYQNFKAFVNDLENYQHTIIISEVSINKDTTKSNVVLGTISLSYPYFTDAETIEPSTEKYPAKPKNADPFNYTVRSLTSVGGGATPNTGNTGISLPEVLPNVNPGTLEPLTPTTQNTQQSEADIISKSDFHMTLSPTVSDSSTTVIGKSPFRFTELYSDFSTVENLTLSLTKVKDQYFYAYANSKESYPSSDVLPFVPMVNGKIVLVVQSQGRLPKDDLSGVLLQIKNGTGLPLEIYVFDDDAKKPRFAYKKSGGKVTITRL